MLSGTAPLIVTSIWRMEGQVAVQTWANLPTGWSTCRARNWARNMSDLWKSSRIEDIIKRRRASSWCHTCVQWNNQNHVWLPWWCLNKQGFPHSSKGHVLTRMVLVDRWVWFDNCMTVIWLSLPNFSTVSPPFLHCTIKKQAFRDVILSAVES